MQSYPHPSEEHGKALDFTPGLKVRAEPVEVPVLDLSCKKQDEQCKSYDMSPLSLETHSRSPSNIDNRRQSFSEDQKSPFEGRNFMVTPPSECDSPKKTKFRTLYPKENSVVTDIMTQKYTVASMIQCDSMIPIVPSPLTKQNGRIVEQITIPPTITPEHTVPIDTSDTKKTPRPFKAYPKDPLAVSMSANDFMYDPNCSEAYTDFRKRMLESVRKTNEGTNIKMRRVSKSPGLPTSTMDDKDAAYWERRRKNNEAAKRSRDARRAKEDEIAIRAAFLEQENLRLKYEVVALRQESAKLRCMVYTN